MLNQEPSPQVKESKRYATTITAPETKTEIFREVARGRLNRNISRRYKAECAAIERVVAEGIREMRQFAPLPRFRGGSVDGFGRPMGRAVIAMPVRSEGRAA